MVNFERQFEEQVVKPFVEEYLAGRTPIPCTLCNNYIKFDRFLEMAEAVGARQIATGHYARIRRDEASGRYQLLRAVDDSKDQTYFLFGLTQEQLARTMFPLGELTKREVRELARSMDLAVAAKGDSQEICFVPNGDYAAFLRAYLEESGIPRERTRGAIVSTDGRTLGEHEGVHHFTVGQRRGLGVATGEPLYVIATDARRQRVIVGGNDDLLRARFFAKGVNWISIAALAEPMRAQVKDPQQARGRARYASRHGRRRARRGGLRRAAARRHPRPGRGLLRWRAGAGRRMDRIDSIYNTGRRPLMFSVLAIVLDTLAVVVPILLLYRFRSQAWYWHVLAAAVALAIGLMPGTALLQTEGGSLLYGFSFIILLVWGIGGLIPYRPRHAKHA